MSDREKKVTPENLQEFAEDFHAKNKQIYFPREDAASVIVAATEAWLDEHAETGEIVVDNTLTIAGAAADAKVTGDQISSIKGALDKIDDEVYELKQTLPSNSTINTITPTITNGEIVLYATGETYSYQDGAIAEISTEFRDKYFVSCKLTGSSAICFYDIDNEYLQDLSIHNTDTIIDYEIIIPENVKKMIVSTINRSTNPIVVKKENVEFVNINNIDTIYTAIPQHPAFTKISGDAITGYFLRKETGEPVVYAAGAYVKINITENKKYFINGNIYGNAAVVFYDENGYMSGEDISDIGAVENYEVTLPSGSKIMGVSTINETDNPVCVYSDYEKFTNVVNLIKNDNSGNYLHSRRPTICFTLDGDYDMNDDILAVANDHKYPLCFALKYPTLDNDSVVARYRNLEGEGHEIALHTNYSLWEYTDEEVIAIIKECYEKGISKGFDIHGCIATAGSMEEKFLPYVRERFDYGATVANHAGSLEGDFAIPCHDFLTSNPYKLWRYSMQTSTIAQQKAAVDDCIENNRLLMFYGHALSSQIDYFAPEYFDELLDYIDTKTATYDCYVKTPWEAIKDFYSIRYDDYIDLLN